MGNDDTRVEGVRKGGGRGRGTVLRQIQLIESRAELRRLFGS